MECEVSGIPVHYVEHGTDGTPIVVLHGAGVDHRELEAALEPALRDEPGFRRVYPDSPGMGRTPAPDDLTGSDDVVDLLLGLVDRVIGDRAFLLVGHSAGAYLAAAITDRRRDRVAGLALICPLVEGLRDVPGHTVVHATDAPCEDASPHERAAFEGYFVVHTRATWQRYRRHVAPAAALADQAALARLGDRWQVTRRPFDDRPYDRPVLILTGRQDATVGYAGQWDLLHRYPRATFAVLDRAGHALPHEQPELLAALLGEWLERVRERRPA